MTLLRYNRPATPRRAPLGASEPAWLPRADAQETPTEYVVRMDAPGLTQSDFSIELNEGSLTVSGERPEATLEDSKFVLRERSTGRFGRRFRFSGKVDADGVKARYENGVLEIRVPKVETLRRIEIQ